MNRWFLPSALLILSGFSTFFLSNLEPDIIPKHLLSIGIGATLFLLISKVPRKIFFTHPWKIYLACVLFLLIPLILPNKIRNTSRWIPIGGYFQVQPSQFAFALMGIATIGILAKITKQYKSSLIRTGYFLSIILIPFVLIAIEPDLGTALFYLLCMIALLFISGTPIRHLAVYGGVGLVCAYFSWMLLLQPYQKQRILTYISPSEATSDQTYNLRQSLIAIGAGGLAGSGIGQGTQSQLRFLPEKHTDFIFAAFSEEFGFLGSLTLILWYLIIMLFLLREAYLQPSPTYQAYITYSALCFFFQAMINVGTNTELLPVTGMTLPFFSYGGTSVIALSVLLAITQAIISQEKKQITLHIV